MSGKAKARSTVGTHRRPEARNVHGISPKGRVTTIIRPYRPATAREGSATVLRCGSYTSQARWIGDNPSAQTSRSAARQDGPLSQPRCLADQTWGSYPCGDLPWGGSQTARARQRVGSQAPTMQTGSVEPVKTSSAGVRRQTGPRTQRGWGRVCGRLRAIYRVQVNHSFPVGRWPKG